ncbi:putative yir3 protein [Plasmodium yoelii yoelii]|uniref:Yir3 protein n=1 Tax=Plasmodium yoelii yoelii TaxID=73239 RepID=Q7R8D0_PLAYO|nr:putative yir3 protein [Plasmodium yoelii yoelii]
MDKDVCRTLIALRNSFSNNWTKQGDYQFIINADTLNGYCSNKQCNSDLERINAGCLYLLDAFYKDSNLFKTLAKSNIDIVEYIMIWLSKMLSRIKNEQNDSIEFFYKTYIKNDTKYTNAIGGVDDYYKSYKDLIDKKNLLNMNIKDISKLYDVFNTLCNMYLEFDEQNPNCVKHLEKAKKFVDEYKKLKENYSITENSLYSKILSTLSTDYDNFKKKYDNVQSCKSLPLPKIENEKYVQSHIHGSGEISEDTSSSSSIASKLFIVLSIFGAIAFFFGISYKYSLFGFRKRFKKQQIREKLKNIKKRMNH